MKFSDKISVFLTSHVTWYHIWPGVVLIFVINIIIFPYIYLNYLQRKQPLDLFFGFSPGYVREILSAYSPAQLRIYRRAALWIDTPYALIYGLTYTLIFIKLNRFTGGLRHLVWLPLFIMFFDWIENAGIVYFTKVYPHIDESRFFVFSLANRLKWTMALLSLIWFAVLLIHRFGLNRKSIL